MRISKSGQISIPAAIRNRWATSTVTLTDEGDRLVVTPAPDDPIATAEGALAEEYSALDVAQLRRQARDDERITEERRARDPARRLRPDRVPGRRPGDVAGPGDPARGRRGGDDGQSGRGARRLATGYGLPIASALEILDPLLEGPLAAKPLDSAVARRAAVIRAVHYHRSSRPISLAEPSCSPRSIRATASPRPIPTSSPWPRSRGSRRWRYPDRTRDASRSGRRGLRRRRDLAVPGSGARCSCSPTGPDATADGARPARTQGRNAETR